MPRQLPTKELSPLRHGTDACREAKKYPADKKGRLARLPLVQVQPDLWKYRHELADLRQLGETIVTTYHTLQVESIRPGSMGTREVMVTKDETLELLQKNDIVQICSGPFRARYQLIPARQGWKIDDSQVVGPEQKCHSPWG